MPTVFLDIDTQIDFLFPAGALYVPGAEKLLPALRRLNRYAASRSIPVVSTMDAHTENDPEFQRWPAHCVAGAFGQQKAPATLLENRVVVPNRPVDLNVGGARQILLEKQALDLFTNRNIEPLLDRLNASGYVVYGVVTEYCVRCAAMGLLKTKQPVTVVADAVRTLDPAAAERFFDEFSRAGGRTSTVAEVCAE